MSAVNCIIVFNKIFKIGFCVLDKPLISTSPFPHSVNWAPK